MAEPEQPEKRRRSASKRTIGLLIGTFLAAWVPGLLSAIGLFLSLWIVVPAPTRWLLPLGVGAPEVSPWLAGLNAIGALSALAALKIVGHSWARVAIVASLVGLGLSLLPLSQIPTANRQAQAALGADYLNAIPPELHARMRPAPFVLADAFRGIPTPQIRTELAIPFAAPADVSLQMNVYRPLSVGKHPAIVVIYGGAWQNGTPNNDDDFSRYMAAQGYTVLAIDYRHAPQYRFPAQLEDVQTALAFIRQHADEYEVDVDRIVLMGRSAGAHLAMLAAFQPDAPPVRAVVSYYGPVDLTTGYHDPPNPDPIDTRAVLRAFLGGTPEEFPDRYRQASPYEYATRPQPPTLLIYAGRDHLVQAKFGRALYERLRSINSPAVFLEIPWAEHAFDAVFNGVSNQLALYYTERFLAAITHAPNPRNR
ncbi:alpha/beta hydrolase [Leptolyngbya sp. FACHB-36]|uniref:alpha/beta hydrolase n=1 Tax=Leptolyngbya sp. FACHB-36 TaxID=2692808 RepID=UPI0016805632|nr:alpha/beta hydrolase [Leptolyngbya sp. FACHB-36]MBD2019904.1 alpha/beta hydrolase [Leptolyngbya sp. FACHB-36]